MEGGKEGVAIGGTGSRRKTDEITGNEHGRRFSGQGVKECVEKEKHDGWRELKGL